MLRRHVLPPAGTTTRGRTVLWLATCLTLATLLDAQPLLATARGLDDGWRRDLALAVMQPVADVAAALGLDVPRRLLDEALGQAPESGPTPTPSAVPSSSPSPLPTAHPTGSPTPSPTPTPSARRVPTPSDPLRIRVVGDSMAQAPGQSLTRMASATGVAQVVLDFRFSSGLTRPDFFDWPRRLATVLADRRPPEVVVAFFGANDAQAMSTAQGVLRYGTRSWDTAYAGRVAATMEQLVRAGADVYWVGQPVARSSSYSSRMAHLDAIYAREAARHPGVRYVDGWSLFAAPGGGYSAYLRIDGTLTLVRLADGIHLTRAGGDRLARVLLSEIAARWRLRP